MQIGTMHVMRVCPTPLFDPETWEEMKWGPNPHGARELHRTQRLWDSSCILKHRSHSTPHDQGTEEAQLGLCTPLEPRLLGT